MSHHRRHRCRCRNRRPWRGGRSDCSQWGAAHRAGSIEHDHNVERCAPYWGSGWSGELDEDIDDLADADGDDGAIKLD